MTNRSVADVSRQNRSLNQSLLELLEDKIAELETSRASMEREVAEHRRAANNLQLSEMRYRRLFESAKDGILILDADTELIVDVNPFLANLLGFTHEHFINKKLWEIGVFGDIASSKAAFSELQEKGYIRYEDLPLKTKDGRQIAVEFVSNVYLVDSARIIQCNIRDITERKYAEESIRLHAVRIQTLLDLHLLSHAPKDRVMDFVAEACLHTTTSKYSFIGAVNENETVMTLQRWSADVTAKRGLPVQHIEYPIADMEPCGECVRLGKPVICNEYEKPLPEKKGFFDGQADIHRILVVPVFDGDRIVAVAAVANKLSDYDAEDANALSILLQKMWELLSLRQRERELNLLEKQYRQAQKMEAIGQLAGGLAHDFNNILQAVLGYSSILLTLFQKNSNEYEYVDQIAQGAERASALTRQLLAFSRRQILKMEELDLNDVVDGMSNMIRRLIGEDIEIAVVQGTRCIIHADRGGMEQVLLNLCLNARDAMPDGGTLTIKIEDVVLDKDYCDKHVWASPGRYALLSITDIGCGMDAATQEHVFEPFFTTKVVGKGTGLGLATVYGIVRQHQGLVQVDSQLGRGTTFRVYLPTSDGEVQTVRGTVLEHVRGGVETILVAEDEKSLRKLFSRILEGVGYRVLLAVNGKEALELFEKHRNEIDLCLLDVVMPKMGGKAVYDILHQRYPNLRFLFSSGYSTDAIHTNFVLEEDIELIQKPYVPEALLRKVRQILDTVPA